MRELIKIHSNKDDLVLDPFMGGGSITIACLAEGRNFVGFELDEDFHQKVIKRINVFSY